MKNIEIKSLIACEDVRHEVGNKSTIVGIFSGVVFSSFPEIMRISLWIEYSFRKKGLHGFSIRVDTPSVKEAATINLEVQIDDPSSPMTTAIPQFPLKIDKPGNISIFVKEKTQKEWLLCREIHVTQGDGDASTINVNWEEK